MNGARSKQMSRRLYRDVYERRQIEADAEEVAPKSRKRQESRKRGKSAGSEAIGAKTLYIGTAVARNPRVRGAGYDTPGVRRRRPRRRNKERLGSSWRICDSRVGIDIVG